MAGRIIQGIRTWRRRPGTHWIDLLVDGFVAAGVVTVLGLLTWTAITAMGSNATAGRHDETLLGDFLTNFAVGRMVLEGDASHLYDEQTIPQARDRPSACKPTKRILTCCHQ